MMAKRKKVPQTHIDCAVTLPIRVLNFYQEVAALAGLTVNDVLNVVVAADVVRNKPPSKTVDESR
jgi:uncharacterized membrane protein YadS